MENLTLHQQELINAIKGEFEKINAQSKEQVGNFFNIGEIKSEFNRKQQCIAEINASNLKFREVANEMAKADFELLKPDFDALGIPISLIKKDNKTYRLLIGNDIEESCWYKFELTYWNKSISDVFSGIQKNRWYCKKMLFKFKFTDTV